ncbi:MAG: type II toxin-antitoxin system HicA family toxin [Bryobacterales bacterium]|nr:type II toxin-antitoxin system HicA family toxin [Bryobacterales bacterium]
MSRFGSLKPRQVLRALQRDGWYVHETSGSHVHLKHPAKLGRVTVPYHRSFDLPKPIVRSVIRQAGLTPDKFDDLL